LSLGAPASPPSVVSPKPSSGDKHISVDPFGEIANRVDALSKLTGRPIEYYVDELFDCLDDLADAHEAEECLAEIESGKVKPIPFSEVKRSLGLGN
jgi:predicted DNA-binding protein